MGHCLNWIAGVLMLLALGVPAAAEVDNARPHGLLWHKSGLPAVFPLQIKSDAGEDYYLRLVDVQTETAVLAAYVRGGEFFRVVVPPGTYEVRFAAGRNWQGEDRLFGPGDETRFFTLPEPLTFEVRNFRTKGGHAIDLSKMGAGEMAAITPLATCQTMQSTYHGGAGASGMKYTGTLRDEARSRIIWPFAASQDADRLGILRWPEGWLYEPSGHWRLEVRTAQCGGQ